VNNTFQIADTVSLSRGNHTIAVGADIRRTQLNSFLDRNFRPQIIFGGTTDSVAIFHYPRIADCRLKHNV